MNVTEPQISFKNLQISQKPDSKSNNYFTSDESDELIETDYEPLERTLLKRDLRAIALQRMEDSARTVSDFQTVICEWDRLDSNRERRERAHEIGRSDIPLKWGASAEEIVIPTPIGHKYWKQITKGEFLDVIYDCPFEMHELLEDEDYSSIIYNLKDEQKELLYYLYIKFYSTLHIAHIRKQSDRNIRSVRSTVLKQLMQKTLLILLDRKLQNKSLTFEEKEFLNQQKPNIPNDLVKLEKEKSILLKEIGVQARKILRKATKSNK